MNTNGSYTVTIRNVQLPEMLFARRFEKRKCYRFRVTFGGFAITSLRQYRPINSVVKFHFVLDYIGEYDATPPGLCRSSLENNLSFFSFDIV